MKNHFKFILGLIGIIGFSCWAYASTTTTNLSLTLPNLGDTGWSTTLNNNFSTIDSLFGTSSGHTHAGTAGNGPKINLATAVQGVLTGTNGGTNQSSLPLTLANGGTEATTAAGARTNLSAAASGANSDITSLATPLGVGVASASAGLHVKGTGQTTGALNTGGTLNDSIILQTSTGSVNNGGAVVFGATQGYFAAIKGLLSNGASNTTGALVFSVRNATGDSTLTEALRLDTNGYLGIGGVVPTAQLHMYGSGQATTTPTTASSLGGAFIIQDSGSSANNGGMVIFGSLQGYFAAIKGLLVNGSTNTTGSISFSTRAAVSDSTLTEAMRILPSGYVGVGSGTPTVKFELIGTGTAGDSMNLAGFGTGSATTFFSMTKGRGSFASPSAVQSGDTLGIFKIKGYDGTSYIDGAWIYSLVDGTPGTNDMPTSLNFATTSDGASAPTTRMTIDNTGLMFFASGGQFAVPNSTTLPATCTAAQLYMDTNATTKQRLYYCDSANTWVALQGI